MELKRRNIVITGGTGGIGRELVGHLHSTNHVLVIASNTRRLEQLASDCPGIVTCCADLADPAGIEAAADQARRRFSRIDLLINNAAVQHEPAFLDSAFDYGSIGREITVNLTAVCALTALLLPALLQGREAAIVNVNSGLALMPKTGSAVYCATKAALNSFSQSLRYQLEDTGVRVMQAFVPLVDTGMTRGRGTGEMAPAAAAQAIVDGIEADIEEHDIGKIRLLRQLVRFAPGLARRIMKAA